MTDQLLFNPRTGPVSASELRGLLQEAQAAGRKTLYTQTGLNFGAEVCPVL